MNRRTSRTLHRFGLFLFVCGLSVLSVGCGGGKSKVTGKVTFQGKTVVWGTVIMIDPAGIYYQGDIDLNGNYSIDGVPSGSVKIGVTSPQPAPPKGRGEPGKATTPKDGASEDPREKILKGQPKAPERPLPPDGAWFPLPKSAGDPNSSGLTGTVKSGEPLNIDVK